ncbi:helix-turn-helix domain-containing protein [Paenibacillus sp.]|jgi:AraC-like DNA-binding protein|uniref:helix-turn-helix domain-containing protein n=1 Tax=Paenibacillus sp. TaxID=58172 RepID=UPI00282343FF|nr:helix-turn-helix domain-containing protein [Paenibacillus sp.]MDR0271604.1 helix-turn-helix domain-containing protein [Paenibacillus sp.]
MSLILKRMLGFPSLFTKLLSGFLAVILLLTAFNLVSFFYLKRQIHNEIVKYNELGMNHAARGYEDQFRITREMVLSLNQDPRWTAYVNQLRQVKDNRAYGYINDVITGMKRLYTNPFLDMDNLIIYFQKDAYVVERDGTSSAKSMFSTYYASPPYPPAFWEGQFRETYAFRVFPVATFSEQTLGSARSKGSLIPVVIKMTPYKDMYLIAMLDAERLAHDLQPALNGNFYILDPEGHPLYAPSTGPNADSVLPTFDSFDEKHSFIQTGDSYYFYKKGKDTGFLYVNKVPVQSISAQLLNLNLLLLSLLAVVGLLVILTFVFSRRVHRPIRIMVDTLRKDEPEPTLEPIREIELISRRVMHMRSTHQRISSDLARKNSILRHYAYVNRLKNIHMNLSELRELADASLPYVMIVYQILFKEGYAEYQLEQEKGAYYIREYIDHIWQQSYPESVTIQTEPQQVLSIVFLPGESMETDSWIRHLQGVFSLDRSSYLVTMAESPIQPAGAPFTVAYSQVTGMLKQRELRDQTQWIRPEDGDSEKESSCFKALWEQEFQNRLLSGSEESMQEWIRKSLAMLEKKGALARDYHRFSKDVAGELDKLLRGLNLTATYETAHVPPLDVALDFYSPDQYAIWFRRLLDPALQLIRRKTENHDPITSFVMAYINDHLEEDINLDMMADKLNITSGYLSTYFKEKTGLNFSDYLNDIRIRTAKDMLQNLDLRIQDVAARIGYQNVNSFIRMFKRHAGMTPGEYRKKYAS